MKGDEYARVSSQDQNIDPQIAALHADGVDKVLREKATGKDLRNSREIERAIDQGRFGAGGMGQGYPQPDGRDPHHGDDGPRRSRQRYPISRWGAGTFVPSEPCTS